MSNKFINNQGDTALSGQTNLNDHRISEGNLIKISLVIVSLVTSIYLFFFDSFLTTQTDSLNYLSAIYEDDLADLVMIQFNIYSFARFDTNVNGFVFGSLLILIGILGILAIIDSQSRGSSLAIKTAIFQLPTGILLIISASLSKTGVKRLVELESPMYAMSAFQTAYWLETICYVLFLTTTIMLAISARRKKYRALETALIVISIGFFIIIIASIFSISTVNKYINSNFAELELFVSYTEVEIAGSLITALILTALAKIILVIAFLLGLISFLRRTNKQFTIIIFVTTLLYGILKLINSILSLIYSLSIFSPDAEIDVYMVYYKRLMTTIGLTNMNMAIYWIVFIVGVFGVLKSIVFEEMSTITSQKTPRISRTADIPFRENVLPYEKPLIPQQQAAAPESRFCTVCGTIAEDDSIVCATCGAYVQNE